MSPDCSSRFPGMASLFLSQDQQQLRDEYEVDLSRLCIGLQRDRVQTMPDHASAASSTRVDSHPSFSAVREGSSSMLECKGLECVRASSLSLASL